MDIFLTMIPYNDSLRPGVKTFDTIHQWRDFLETKNKLRISRTEPNPCLILDIRIASCVRYLCAPHLVAESAINLVNRKTIHSTQRAILLPENLSSLSY